MGPSLTDEQLWCGIVLQAGLPAHLGRRFPPKTLCESGKVTYMQRASAMKASSYSQKSWRYSSDAASLSRMLYDFCQKQGERKVSAIYLVMGRGRATGGAGPMEVDSSVQWCFRRRYQGR